MYSVEYTNMMIPYKSPKNRDMGPVCCLVWPYGRNDVMGHGRGVIGVVGVVGRGSGVLGSRGGWRLL